MENQDFTITKFWMHTEKGSFAFARHHWSTCDPYDAMLNFRVNNSDSLGGGMFNYEVELSWKDGVKSIDSFDGMNAGAHLAEYLSDCYPFVIEQNEKEEAEAEAEHQKMLKEEAEAEAAYQKILKERALEANPS